MSFGIDRCHSNWHRNRFLWLGFQIGISVVVGKNDGLRGSAGQSTTAGTSVDTRIM